MLPYLALAVGVLAFSTSGVLAKLCDAPAVTMAFWVRVFSLAYLATAFFLRNPKRAPSLLRTAGRHGLAGGSIFGLHVLAYFAALKLTSVTVVFLVGALNPAVVGLFGVALLGERLDRRQLLWTAIAIAAAGAVVFARDASGSTPLYGNVMAVLAALGYCSYFLVSRHARRTVGATEYLTVVMAVSMVVIGVAAFAVDAPLAIGSSRDLGLIALLALVPATIGHLTVNWALRHVEAHAAATVLLIVPLFASLWAHLFVGERVTLAQIAAGAVVLLAIPGAINRSPVALLEVPTDPGGEVPVEPIPGALRD